MLSVVHQLSTHVRSPLATRGSQHVSRTRAFLILAAVAGSLVIPSAAATKDKPPPRLCQFAFSVQDHRWSMDDRCLPAISADGKRIATSTHGAALALTVSVHTSSGGEPDLHHVRGRLSFVDDEPRDEVIRSIREDVDSVNAMLKAGAFVAMIPISPTTSLQGKRSYSFTSAGWKVRCDGVTLEIMGPDGASAKVPLPEDPDAAQKAKAAAIGLEEESRLRISGVVGLFRNREGTALAIEFGFAGPEEDTSWTIVRLQRAHSRKGGGLAK